LYSCKKLSARAIANPDLFIAFDKDDDDTLDFVLATANLRATAYGIACKTRFEVKGMFCRPSEVQSAQLYAFYRNGW
jgi:ubiquitin-like 1-activating enzyme E1 B